MGHSATFVKYFSRPRGVTLPEMSGDTPPKPLPPLPPGIQGNMVQRIRAIPNGKISETARRAGIALETVLKWKRSEGTNVTLETLEQLARGLQIPPSAVIAGPGDEAYLPPETREPLPPDPHLARALTKVRAALDDAERAVIARGVGRKRR